MSKTQTARRLTAGIIAVIVLSVCLCITTFALIYARVSIEDNLFETGSVDINLNGGEAVIQENEFLFEPGMTVKKDFFVKNESTWPVYYRIYFDKVSGGLSDILQITIKDKDDETVLWQGTANELTREKVVAAKTALVENERRNLQIYFYYPPDSGNAGKDQYLWFNLCAEATQTKNNDERKFD